MKIRLIFLLSILTFAATASSTNGIDEIDLMVIKYDPSCTQKYVFQVDPGFIVDDSHTAYHVRLDEETTVVLKVFNTAETRTSLPSGATVIGCAQKQKLDQNFVIAVNSGLKKVYILDGKTYLEVASTEYEVDNDTYFSSFAPPYHSYVFEYHQTYEPLQAIAPAGFDGFDYDTRHFYYNSEQERAENRFVMLRMYRDACINRPFGMVTPRSAPGEQNPYKFADAGGIGAGAKSVGAKKVMRSCQHPVQVEHLKNVGVTRETYEEDGTVYTSQLVSVDGVPFQQYAQKVNAEKDFTAKSGSTAPVSSAYRSSTDAVAFPKQMVARSAFVPTNNEPAAYTAENTPTPASTTVVKEKFPVVEPFNEEGIFADIMEYEPENAPKIVLIPEKPQVAQAGEHLVQQGETLYSLSKRYNSTVLKLMELNGLESEQISIGQILKVK